MIGVDSSAGMLEVCRARAEAAGVAELLDLRLGDLRDPPVDERSRSSPAPSAPTSTSTATRSASPRCARRASCSSTGGRLSSTSSRPSRDDIEETHGRWLEREPGIWERADWDERERRLTLSVRGDGGEGTMTLAWFSVAEWQALLERAGFEVEACYGWFDRRPYAGGEDSVWIATRPLT